MMEKEDLMRRILQQVKQQLDGLEQLLEARNESVDMESLVERLQTAEGEVVMPIMQERGIDGVFDGELMVGEDGRKYPVPPNYASKSKLVEGDLLRLTITDAGRFIFKQKGPIDRQRLVGMLICDEQTDEWKVAANGYTYRVLGAAISYFKGAPGDEAVILVPKQTPSRWAAVENVIKRGLSDADA